jgi:hypothetical protein
VGEVMGYREAITLAQRSGVDASALRALAYKSCRTFLERHSHLRDEFYQALGREVENADVAAIGVAVSAVRDER